MKMDYKKNGVLLFFLLFAPPVLAVVKDSLHGNFQGVHGWELVYNAIGGMLGGVFRVVSNWQNPKKYSNNLLVELVINMFVSGFAALLTYLLVAGTDVIAISGLTMLFMACCAGVLGAAAVDKYTDKFTKKIDDI